MFYRVISNIPCLCYAPRHVVKIPKCQIRTTFEYGNDVTIANAFIGSIFVEVELKPTLLMVVEAVEFLLGEFLFNFLYRGPINNYTNSIVKTNFYHLGKKMNA